MAPIPRGPDAYRPVLFPDDEPLDSSTLARIRADPCTIVLDHGEALSRQADALRSRPAVDETGAGPHWAYFPWRRTLVTIPGPDRFRRMRFDRNRYQITTAEQERFRDIRIGVAGLSVGHSIAVTLAMEGLCGHLRLADFDDLELSNLNRLPATVLDLGVNKAVIAARRIAEMDPYLRVEVDTRGVRADSVAEFVDGLDIVVDECDSLDIKVELRLAARERGIPVIMATSDRGLVDVERFDLDRNLEIFHGLLGELDPTALQGLSTRDKAPFVMRILEADELSARLAASLVEADRTLSSWPQLASEVTLGAAAVAAAVRRLVRAEPLPSGRTRVDLDQALATLRPPALGDDIPAAPPQAPADPQPARTGEALDAMVDAIRLAPSGGNSQPWAVTRYPDRFEITQRFEQTTAMDVGFRGSQVAIGAATFNARVAAARFGVLGPVEIVENPQTRLPRVCIRLGDATDDVLGGLYDSMVERMSNRTVGLRQHLDGDTLQAFRQAVASDGGRLTVATEPDQLAALADVLASSDRLRYLTPTLHRQMIGELSWPGRDPLDRGIDVRTLSLDATDMVKLRVGARSDVMAHLADWDLGTALGDNTRDRVRDASGLAVVTVRGDSLRDYVIGGMAMEHLWVLANRFGFGVYPISPVFIYARTDNDLATLAPQYAGELDELRDRFRRILAIDTAEALILVLRIVHRPGVAVRSGRLSRWTNILAKLE